VPRLLDLVTQLTNLTHYLMVRFNQLLARQYILTKETKQEKR